MVQYHALGLLYHLRKQDRLAITKLLAKLTKMSLRQGWKKPGLKKKKPTPWVFLGFLGFFYIYAQKREFIGFLQFREYFLVHPDLKF
jgi:hypothetical protein